MTGLFKTPVSPGQKTKAQLSNTNRGTYGGYYTY